MESFGLTEKGKVRPNNQDNILLNRELQCFMVADGMGGHACGEVASEMAVQKVNDHLRTHLADARQAAQESMESVTDLLKDAFHLAHDAIYDYSQKLPGREFMGTTLSLLFFRKNTAYITHVGDSRVYRLRGGHMEKLTKDHTEAQDLVDSELITEEEAENHRLSHVVTRVLGVPDRWKPDVHVLDVEPSDRFLLSSDGLFRDVPVSFVQEVLAGDLPVREKCSILVEKALANGARDNVSVIVLEPGDMSGAKSL